MFFHSGEPKPGPVHRTPERLERFDRALAEARIPRARPGDERAGPVAPRPGSKKATPARYDDNKLSGLTSDQDRLEVDRLYGVLDPPTLSPVNADVRQKNLDFALNAATTERRVILGILDGRVRRDVHDSRLRALALSVVSRLALGSASRGPGLS